MLKLPSVAAAAAALAALASLPAPALAQPEPGDGAPVIVVTPPPVVMAPGMAPGPVGPQVAVSDAPQNEDWANVSHINGRPVPIGTRGDYLYKWKKTNIATNPIGWMFGFYGLSISTAVHDNVALRGDANIFDLDGASGYEVGASAAIYFKRVYQGPFLEPGIIARELRDSDDFGGTSDSEAMVGPEMLFGWHWTFDSGLNVAAAFGAARDLRHRDADGDSQIEPAGYFRIGYAF